MVVFESNVGGASICPSKRNAPLQVYPDRIAPRALKGVKTIGRRLIEIFDAFGGVEIQESLQRLTLQIGWYAADCLSLPYLRSYAVGETLNHSLLKHIEH